MAKPKVAFDWSSSCDDCEETVADLSEYLCSGCGLYMAICPYEATTRRRLTG
ncbi:MAG: hypothetical protein R6T78_02440 [Dehalococcoidales bacterium]